MHNNSNQHSILVAKCNGILPEGISIHIKQWFLKIEQLILIESPTGNQFKTYDNITKKGHWCRLVNLTGQIGRVPEV